LDLQRFIPSEFGFDVDRAEAIEPANSLFVTKAKIRRAIEAEGVPYTIVCSNAFAGYTLPSLAKSDKVVIFGHGNNKGIHIYMIVKVVTLTRTCYFLQLTLIILPLSQTSLARQSHMHTNISCVHLFLKQYIVMDLPLVIFFFQQLSLVKKISQHTLLKRSMTLEL